MEGNIELDIFIECVPVPKSSIRTGKGYAYYKEPYNSYRKELIMIIKSLRLADNPIDCPMEASFIFHMPRPKKPKHDIWCITTPDMSNLIKGIEDIMTSAGVIIDDKLIVKYGDCSKPYAIDGKTGIEIKLWRVE